MCADISQQGISAETGSIQVLNLSFPRCGTMSLQAALDQLGYKCWHSMTCFGDTAQCRQWIAAQDGKFLSQGKPFTRPDWDGIFKNYTAVSADPPATAFAEELIDIYPDAKVILVERDEDEWFSSMNATTMSSLFRWDMHAVASMDPMLVGPVRDMQWHWVRLWWRVSTKAEMSAKARFMFREHNKMIRARTPPHRLLVFRLEDGWDPLCRFLGKNVPDMPFPVRNDRQQAHQRYSWIRQRGLRILGLKALQLLGPLLIGAVAWWGFRVYTS